jgi:nicotinic acid phosphoribosyltransferase
MQKLNQTFKINPLYEADGYKVAHHKMLAPGTTKLYGTWIPRSLKYMPSGIDKIMSAGQQLVVRHLHSTFQENFFDKDSNVAIQFANDMSAYLGMDYDGTHFLDLYKLGYLPIRVKSLPEGIFTQPNIPHMTFVNTVDGYAWLTLFLETYISKLAWQMPTVATIGHKFKENAKAWVNYTDKENLWLADFMCHDFHSRGGNPFTSIACGLGFSLSNKGSDTLNIIPASRYYYDEAEDSMPIFSVNASEHSVSTTKIFTVGEQQMIADWLKLFPTGILSVVSDTFSLWDCIEYFKELKDEIMGRDGKLVCRPDCLDDKSQILTPKGWKYFKDLTENDLVAQVKKDGIYEFVKPLKIINEPYEGDMYEIRDFHGKIDLVVTPNHRLVSYKNSDNSISIKEASDYKQNYWEYKKLRSPKSQSKGRELTAYERFLIALQADGCIKYVNKDLSTRIEFNFKKERKHDRLLEILKNTDLEYNVYFTKSRQGQSTFSVLIPYNRMVSKTFDWVDTSNLDSLWAEEFIEELKYWDSSIRNDGRFKYDTTIKENIDVVELVAIAAGKGVYISESEDNRKKHFSNVYTAHILDNPYVGGQSITKNKIHYKGTIHCVKVPTGMILVKRNQGVCVTGNSGDPVDIICGVSTKYRDLSAYLPEGEVLPEYFEEVLLEEVREDTPHGKRGVREYENVYTVRGKLYKAKIHNISWNRHDKQYYFIDMWEKAEITIEELEWKPSDKGVIELLWDIFGGTVNEEGYKVLDPHIGAIYGDSINLERQIQIYERLEAKGFAASNIVLGVGSYTMVMLTRDSAGYAAKGSWFEVKEETGNLLLTDPPQPEYKVTSYNIYKDPVTDGGSKKSLKGLMQVKLVDNEYVVNQECTWEQEEDSELKTIYENGVFKNQTTLSEIRSRVS